MADSRLAKEPSAYLRSAAHQPIAWYPWGAEAFEAARAADKPVLLDVGAVWCHWCHVMDGESYDDPELAKLINERFVPVKVDRDERPDVDARYQKAVGAITGQGGWPLTAFLTPQGDVFYGGTYFPPTEAHGRPSFRRVLEAVSEAYRGRRGEIEEQAQHLRDHLGRPTARPAEGDLGPAWAKAALDALLDHHDPVHGGWGNAPKFPHPSAIEALLDQVERTGDPAARGVVEATLDRMARGGVRDHVGGGFHRYSVDATWHVPHFEKMLYDNAELLRNYVQAHRVLGRAEDREVALDIVRFLDTVLSDRERGGFYGSQDADVAFGDDGDYFTWTREEVLAATQDERLARELGLRYGLEARGPMHHNPSKNVLRALAEPGEIAHAQGRSVADVEADLAKGLGLLRRARATRKAPFVDPVLYANWNAMAIRAYLEAAGVLRRPDLAAFALKTLDRFLAEAYAPAEGFAHTLAGKAVRGLLDDNAQMLVALLAAHAWTQDASYLDRAREVATFLESEFWDDEAGGFVDVAKAVRRSAPVGILQRPERPVQDSPSPSANARALEGLRWLAEATGDARLAAFVERAMKRLAPEARALGIFGAALTQVAARLAWPPPKAIVAGPESDPAVAALRGEVLARAPPGSVVWVVRGPADRLPVPPEAKAFAAGPARVQAGVLVCRGDRCLPPAHSPDAVGKALAARG